MKNADLWQALDHEASRHQVTWHWVKGHSGHPENELADSIANQAIDELLEKENNMRQIILRYRNNRYYVLKMAIG